MTGIPSTMRAARFTRTGPAAEVLELIEIAVPEPRHGEVLVQVAASGINPHDTKLRAGWRNALTGIDVVPHGDGAGRIAAVGADVDPARIGERVWFFGAGSGPEATGSAAEYTIVRGRHAAPLPDDTGYGDGACLGIPAMTAHRAVFWDGPVAGQTVLVAGGAGAVAGYAMQFAKHSGALVIATISTPEKAAHARKLGADHVVDYRADDAAEQVLALTGGGGVDRIVEVDFGANVELNAQILRTGGTIASYSSTRERNPRLPYYDYGAKAATIHFVRDAAIPEAAREAAIADVTQALEAGGLTHTIAARYPLDRIAAAHEHQEAGRHIGKILLDVGDIDAGAQRPDAGSLAL